jgi:hypothetical protein
MILSVVDCSDGIVRIYSLRSLSGLCFMPSFVPYFVGIVR